MWDGPYGDWGSRKYLIASLDQSLKRMGLEYVDIFYHHRPDPETPLLETMRALDHSCARASAVRRAFQLSSRPGAEAVNILNDLGTPCIIHQQNTRCWNAGLKTDCWIFCRPRGSEALRFHRWPAAS
jgi:L-glyceraldehyde 3-phosphate reductase